MSNKWVQFAVYFVFIILIQGLVLNNIQIGVYVHPMAYILILLMLPFEINFFITLLVALILGIGVDALSDTFGLHTSSALLVGYIRPYVLKLIRPRDGYEANLMPSVHDMGFIWFLTYSFICIGIHHFWCFTIEVYRLDLIKLILLKTIMSSLVSFGIIFLLQYIFYKPSK